jgi:ABC-type glycerol-3-phosphate transport system substrate-binding protein
VLLLCILLAACLFACQDQPPAALPSATPTIPASPTTVPTKPPMFPELTPTTSAYPGLVEPASTAYPGIEPLVVTEPAYPGVQPPDVNPAYPPVQATIVTQPPFATAYPQPLVTEPALSTPIVQIPALQPTPARTIVSAQVIVPLGTPPPYGGTVTLWHAWDPAQSAALMQVVAGFQKTYPDVRFDILVLPQADLLTRYDVEAYNGGGPSLLIGPSDWTAYLVDRALVEDLTPYVSEPFRQTIYPAALQTGLYQGQLACLPLNLSGALLYRNTLLLPEPADTVAEMLAQAEAATRAGSVGAYLERGFAFSFAHLYGLGGSLLDEQGAPAFQVEDYRYSLAWVELLQSFARPGAYAFNDEKDTSYFTQGRVGYLVDGSWNLPRLRAAVGAERLAIDPWPSLPGGSLSGYVKAESLYLNINTAANSELDHLATLRFMGFLMTVPVQEYLAAQGQIPSLVNAAPQDALLKQAHAAMAGGTAYPASLLGKDGAVRMIYQDTLDAALRDIFENGTPPRQALEKALADIQQRLEALK